MERVKLLLLLCQCYLKYFPSLVTTCLILQAEYERTSDLLEYIHGRTHFLDIVIGVENLLEKTVTGSEQHHGTVTSLKAITSTFSVTYFSSFRSIILFYNQTYNGAFYCDSRIANFVQSHRKYAKEKKNSHNFICVMIGGKERTRLQVTI